VGKQSWVGQPASQSAGGSISGEAASWREAGERLNGYLACKSYSRNTVTLRVHDLDLERGTITVRRGKGDKDRVSVLPERIRAGLTAHLADRRAQFQRDLDMGAGYVPLPGGLARKKPGAARSWAWQYVFGGQNLIVESATGHLIRWHVHENTVGRLLAESARRCGVLRQVTCHSLRHTFATLALENGTDIRTLQELLGHNDVSTTMIYTHVMNRPGVVARSPLDGLAA
jgi:integrase